MSDICDERTSVMAKIACQHIMKAVISIMLIIVTMAEGGIIHAELPSINLQFNPISSHPAASPPKNNIPTKSAQHPHLLSLLASSANSGSIKMSQDQQKLTESSQNSVAYPFLASALPKAQLGKVPGHYDSSPMPHLPSQDRKLEPTSYLSLLYKAASAYNVTDWQKLKTSGVKHIKAVTTDTELAVYLQALLPIITHCFQEIANTGHPKLLSEIAHEITKQLRRDPSDRKSVNLDAKQGWQLDVDNFPSNPTQAIASQKGNIPLSQAQSLLYDRDVTTMDAPLFADTVNVMAEVGKITDCESLLQLLMLLMRDPTSEAISSHASLIRTSTPHNTDVEVNKDSARPQGISLDSAMQEVMPFTILGNSNVMKRALNVDLLEPPRQPQLPSFLSRLLQSMPVNPTHSQLSSAHTFTVSNDRKSIASQATANVGLLYDKLRKSVLPRLPDGNANTANSTDELTNRSKGQENGALETTPINNEPVTLSVVNGATNHEEKTVIELITQRLDNHVRDNNPGTQHLSKMAIFRDIYQTKPGVAGSSQKMSVNANLPSGSSLKHGMPDEGHYPGEKVLSLRKTLQALSDVIVQVKASIAHGIPHTVKSDSLKVNSSQMEGKALKASNGSMISHHGIVSSEQKNGDYSMINQVKNMMATKPRHKRDAGPSEPAKSEIVLDSEALVKPDEKVVGNKTDSDESSKIMPEVDNSNDTAPEDYMDDEASHRSHMYLGLVDTKGRDANKMSWADTDTDTDMEEDSGPKQQHDLEHEYEEPVYENLSGFGGQNEDLIVDEDQPKKEVDDKFKTEVDEDFIDSGDDEYEIVLPDIEYQKEQEYDAEGEPEVEPEVVPEVEPEGETSSTTAEPESKIPANDDGGEAEPESENHEDNSLAEPEPEWADAKDKWNAAWEIHIYSVGIIFAILALYSAVAILRLWKRQNLLSRGYFLSLNCMILLMGTCRAMYFLIDGYNSQQTFHPVIGYFLFGIGFPCLTSAFSILFLALLQTTRVKLISQRILKPVVLVVIIAFHFMLSITTDFTVGYFMKAKVMLFVCQIFFVLWGLFLFFGFMYLFKKLVLNARRRHKEMTRVTESHRNLNGSPVKKPARMTLTLAIKVTMITAILGLIGAGLQIYAMAGVYSIFSDRVPDPWPWWAFKFSMRLVELGMCLTMSYVATQPLRYHSNISDSNAGGILNYLLPCQRVCARGNDEAKVNITDMDGNYQYPNGCYQNGGSPETPDGFYGNAIGNEFDETFPMAEDDGTSACNKDTLSSKDKYSTAASRRSRPLSMLVDDNGFIRFRQEGDQDAAAAMYSTDDELGSCGDILDDNADVIQNGYLPRDQAVAAASCYHECKMPLDTTSKLQSVSVPNTGANTPLTPRSFYSVDSEGAFSEVFNFRPPSSIHLRDSIDRALNYPHFNLKTPDLLDTPDNLSRPDTPDNLEDPKNHNEPMPPQTSAGLHCDYRVYPAYPVHPMGQIHKRKSSLRSIISHLNKSRASSRQVSRRGSEDMLSRGSMGSLGFKSTTSGFRSNGSLSFFDDMSFKTATVDKISMLEDRKSSLYRSRSNSDSMQF